MTRVLAEAVDTIYQGPMVEGFPPNTAVRMGGYDLRRDGYPIWMRTRFYGSTPACEVWSEVLLFNQDVRHATGSERGLIEAMNAKLKLLRMRHYFTLAYERGGYC